jgi:hypothetical protein
MASPERTWPRWTRIALRLAIFGTLTLVGILVRHHDTNSRATTGPPSGYTARFPVEPRNLIHRGVDLFYFRDSVGHVTGTSIEGDKLVVHVVIDAESRAKVEAMDPAFQVYRDRQYPSQAWIALIPKDREGKPMRPKQAVRTWGRTAS